MLSIKVHNILDYCLGAAFLLTPYLFGFDGVNFAHDVFMVIGLALIGYSLITDYRYSAAKIIPVSMHMTFDIASGLFVILAPWVYGYREEMSLPQLAVHGLLGMAALLLVALTNREQAPTSTVLVPEAEFEEERQRRYHEAA